MGSHNRLAVHHGEQRTIALVLELRADGMPYRAVARELSRRRRFNRVGNPFSLDALLKIVKRHG